MPFVAALTLMLANQAQIKTVSEFKAAMNDLDSVGIRRAALSYLSTKGFDRGVNPLVDDRTVVLGIKVDGAKKVEARLVPGGPTIQLTEIAPYSFGGTVECQYGDAYTVNYYADGKKVGDSKRVEVYKFPEEMTSNPSVPKGELKEMMRQVSKVYPDTQSDWWVYKPAAPEPAGGYGLIIFQDGQGAKNYAPTCLDNMIAKGDIPPCIAIFIKPSETLRDKKSIRSRQYDVLSDEYTKFILDEYEPAAASALRVKISQDPSKRCLAGVSSGGICAFTAAWERPDKFGLVMSWVGSFTNIASGATKREGGHNYPFLIRKTDKKPIRIFLQDGDQDLDNEHGNWFLGAEEMEAALKFKGYDYMWRPGHGFHSDTMGRSLMPEALRFLFAGSK